VWIADIGDNDSKRAEVRVYRVDEPHVDAQSNGAQTSTSNPDVWRLRYPGGPVDAEGLAVAPGGAAYIFTKSIFGATGVYALPARPDPAKVQALRRIGEITFRPTGTPGGPNIVGQVTATGAALSHDGSVLAVRTYTDAYLWPVRGGDVARALRAAPVRTALPQQPQGEGITVDRTRLLIDSEGAHSGVLAVTLPRLSTATPSRSATPAPSSTPSRSTSKRSGPGIAVIAVVLLALAAGAWTLRRQAGRARKR
jgi:hypothetical protein